MADYIKRIRTSDGDKQIDYEALANLPDLPFDDYAKKKDLEEINNTIGDIETALDSIIAIQTEMIGGDTE